ncbi:MAG: rhodanese-like domain-containing protein [Methylococcales bacterium]|jgi:rhodanese-related sulfurtransferase|nr:rhodanese-like domain-containing protein [Methylococcales bacterium]MBT7446048.1 rhodanese-like domain-containing protein [Methylococcales bacterium]
MGQFAEFLGNHPLLSAVAFVIIVLLIQDVLGASINGIKNLNPVAATGLINHEEAVVLDVREASEFSTGHILNAIHIPFSKLNDQLSKLEKHKDAHIIISCRTGARSGSACKVLKKLGYEKLYNLQGGVVAWEGANLPLTKK